MAHIIIACIIVAAGAVVEGLAYIFACRMDRKRKEGLDRRQAAIAAREDCLDRREVQLDCREADLAEREKQIPKGIFPTDRLEVVTVNRPIRKLRAGASVDFDNAFGERGCLASLYFADFVSDYTEQIKDGLRDRICETARGMVIFSYVDDILRGTRHITAELWVAEGGPDNGLS